MKVIGDQFEYYSDRIWHEILLYLNGNKLALATHIQPTPFFIIGSGRCGTTMLRVQLEHSPNIIITPESGGAFEQSVRWFLSKGHTLSSQEIQNGVFSIYQQEDNWRYWDLSLPTSQLHSASLGEAVLQLYLAYRDQNKPEATFVGDKNPYLTFQLPYLIRTFPKAKFIHMVRDGRDVVSSWWNSTSQYSDLESICDRWNWALAAVDKMRKRLGDQLMEISYETFVAHPERVLQGIKSFIGDTSYEYSENRFLNPTSDLVKTHHEKSTKPIDQKSIGKWEMDLSPGEQQKILPKLKKNLLRYGYLD